MRLSELLSGLGASHVSGMGDPEITAVTVDPEEVQPGTLFVARRAWWGDQHLQLSHVQHAAAVVVSKQVKGWHGPLFRTDADDPFLGRLCDRFYGAPTQNLKVYGVTGTNGKTSTVCLLDHFLRAVGERPASMGTLGYQFEAEILRATNTTPDAIVIHRFAHAALQRGATALALEVSSHGLDLQRVAGVDFDAVGFTMLGRDHLDHHHTVAAYRRAKAQLFSDHTHRLAVAFDNADGRTMLAHSTASTCCLGVDLAWRVIDRPAFGQLRIEFDGAIYEAPFFGVHEAKNAVLAATMVGGLDPYRRHMAMASLAEFRGVPGRLQQVPGVDESQRVLIDYAHSPDAVSQIVETLRAAISLPICVVLGCGGDRDVGKRPMMAAAAMAADTVILTNDNPRSESPTAILDAMWRGIAPAERWRARRLPDRAEAIATAIRDTPRGVVLIVGKGHERAQIIGDEARVFEDVVEARSAVEALLLGQDPLADLMPFADRPLRAPLQRLPTMR